ncbi:unnamed protein product [Trifolium pratense]|uniref:Uncharacterized protein n=1 Tax=Trifolium pratense TaxID=57577 RepID=A0ACB0L8I9_TRIPR|nr:unnamed protein product [Trifolium pratense]
MGQILNKFQGEEWRKTQVRKITDRVFQKVRNQIKTEYLSFEDLYIAVLLVYNDINKIIPGPHFDPPSKETVRQIMQKITADTFTVVSQKLIITLVVAPSVAMATKRATEGVPGVGKVVQKLPNAIYASLVTLAVVWFQKIQDESTI